MRGTNSNQQTRWCIVSYTRSLQYRHAVRVAYSSSSTYYFTLEFRPVIKENETNRTRRRETSPDFQAREQSGSCALPTPHRRALVRPAQPPGRRVTLHSRTHEYVSSNKQQYNLILDAIVNMANRNMANTTVSA